VYNLSTSLEQIKNYTNNTYLAISIYLFIDSQLQLNYKTSKSNSKS